MAILREKKELFFVLAVRNFTMVARCSKYDFWNLWEIWDRNRWSKKFWAKKKSSKKIRKLFGRKNFGTKKFRFFYRKKIVVKIDENSKFWNFDFFSKFFRNFKILNFHWFFQRKFFREKNRIFFVKKKRQNSFRVFFDDFFFAQFFLGHLFRSQISPRFQKSHLENCAMRPGASPGQNKKVSQKLHFFALYAILPPYTGSTVETFCAALGFRE